MDGKPLSGVELALVVTDRHSLAVGVSDARGRFSLAAGADFHEAWVIAKLHRPIVGGVAVRVTAASAPIKLALSSKDVVTLSATILLPAGARAEWLDVHVTPVELAGVPEAIVGAFCLDGLGSPSLRDSVSVAMDYHTVRISRRRVTLRLLRGTYHFEVRHYITLDGPMAPLIDGDGNFIDARTLLPPNLATDSILLPDGSRSPDSDSGATQIKLDRNLAVKVKLRVTPFD